MNDIKRIRFEANEKGDRVKIFAVVSESELIDDIEIGQIFSDGSYSGKNSIQICGFDKLEGPWSCGCFEKSMDICLKWNDEEQWLEMKRGKK